MHQNYWYKKEKGRGMDKRKKKEEIEIHIYGCQTFEMIDGLRINYDRPALTLLKTIKIPKEKYEFFKISIIDKSEYKCYNMTTGKG